MDQQQPINVFAAYTSALDEKTRHFMEEAMRSSQGQFPVQWLQTFIRRLAAKDMELQDRERQVTEYVKAMNYSYQQQSQQSHYRSRDYERSDQYNPRGSHDGRYRPYRGRGSDRDNHRGRGVDYNVRGRNYERREYRGKDKRSMNKTYYSSAYDDKQRDEKKYDKQQHDDDVNQDLDRDFQPTKDEEVPRSPCRKNECEVRCEHNDECEEDCEEDHVEREDGEY
jgi:hypothetical protein